MCYRLTRLHILEATAITAVVKSVNLALPDVTLRLDMDGIIREVSLANSVSSEGLHDWIGRPWAETVGDVGSDKVLHMVADARANGVSDFRQITQRFPSGLELPMEYNTVRLGGNAGLIAVGKCLRAVADTQSRLLASQHLRELDAWKLREVETRYRLLFESSDDPIVLLRPQDLHILDANPAAIRAGALDAGRDFPAAVAPQDRRSLQAMLSRVADQGRAPGALLHLGTPPMPWLVRASLTTAEPEPAFLLQLTRAEMPDQAAGEGLPIAQLVQRLPDGFALLDLAGTVRHANRAFLDLVQAAVPAVVIGQPIRRWLSRPGADAAVLTANVRRYRVVRGMTTSIHGELGSDTAVEISAAGDADTDPKHIGILLRDISRRLPADAQLPASAGSEHAPLLGPLVKLTEQIGQTPLLQLVREAGDLIERHYIDNALRRADGNRKAAAELLGLSRQSLYVKLNRHGIGGMDGKAARR